MLKQLKELLEMQRLLDESIFRKKGILEYPEENMKIALFVELGELMNELPTYFKHWKSTSIDNRDKALIEFVDCLHFALSLTNHKYNRDFLEMKIKEYEYDSYYTTMLSKLPISDLILHQMKFKGDLLSLFALGNKFGFEWNEIYETYLNKNAVNYERLNGGY